MARVRLLTGIVTQTDAWEPGDVYVCDPETAARLVAEGYAEWVDGADAVETTAVSAPERAIRRRGRPRKASAPDAH